MPISNFIKKDLKEQYNLGDDYCTPDRYFNITIPGQFKIIGGGAYIEYGLKRLKKLNINPNNVIAWGIGQSDKDATELTIDKLPYLSWGIRDKKALRDPNYFLPCVSCLNDKIISQPKSNKTLVYINAEHTFDNNISKENILVMKNDVRIDEFLKKWQECDTIVTNSYHGIYWGLLSGRSIFPIGYSNKFLSVMEIFDLKFPNENYYKPKNKNSLNDLVAKGLTKGKFYATPSYEKFHKEFIDINLNFSKSLNKFGINCTQIKPV